MKKKTKKKIKFFIVLLLIILTATGGYFILNKEVDKPSGENEIKKEIKEEKVTPVTIVDTKSKSRPYAVMINNISTARPYHSGLQDAYITYEIIVEGGITRYLALFKDQVTEKIGSVRSARHYYIDYALENDAYLVHWGGSPYALDDIKKFDIDNINGTYYEGRYFYREKLPISSEHTGFTKMSMLNSAVTNINYREDTNQNLLLNYSGDKVKYENVTSARNVSINYSYLVESNFTYDEENQYYLMSVNDKAHTDHVTKEQYHYKNIITYQIENYTMPGEEAKGRQTIENIGSGTGYYISNGEAIKINWKKTSRESQTEYTYLDGKELIVNDGNTYIGIQPIDEELIIE